MVQKCQEPESAYEAKRHWKTFDSAGPLQCCAKVCISLDTFPPPVYILNTTLLIECLQWAHSPHCHHSFSQVNEASMNFDLRGDGEKTEIDRPRSAEIKDEEHGSGWGQEKG